jgi:hypothetical protein
MRKKTSTVIGLAIATILTTFISALTMSNQAFAQASGISSHAEGFSALPPPVGATPETGAGALFGAAKGQSVVGNELAGVDGSNTWAAQLGQTLGGITTTIHHTLKGSSGQQLGNVPTSDGTFSAVNTAPHLGQALGGITTTVHHILKGGTTTGLGANPVCCIEVGHTPVFPPFVVP